MHSTHTTTTEVSRTANRQRAEREIARLNDLAFPGQRYTYSELDHSTFAIVLIDTDAAESNKPMLTTEREYRERFTARDFAAMGGQRHYRRQRGEYRTFA